MNGNELYKGFSFKPASEKSLNGKYFPRGEIVKKTDTESKILKTFPGEYASKKDADIAFVEFAKKFIDETFNNS